MHAFLAKRMGLFCFAFTMTHTANKWVMSEAVCGEEKRHSQGQCVRRYAGKHLARLIMLSVRNERLVTAEIQEPLFQLPGHFWEPGKSPGVAAAGMGAEPLCHPYWFITVSWGLFVLPNSLPRSDALIADVSVSSLTPWSRSPSPPTSQPLAYYASGAPLRCLPMLTSGPTDCIVEELCSGWDILSVELFRKPGHWPSLMSLFSLHRCRTPMSWTHLWQKIPLRSGI